MWPVWLNGWAFVYEPSGCGFKSGSLSGTKNFQFSLNFRVAWQGFIVYPFKRQYHKMVKHTQTTRRQFADELFECVRPFSGIGA